MIIVQHILDDLSTQTKVSPQLRMNLDLRNSLEDKSRWMLNALGPGMVMPIYRHLASSETVIYFVTTVRSFSSMKTVV